MNKDLISIIVPTFNRAGTITKSINSLIKQTYNNIEIIIVDDGSTDNTESKVKKIKDPRVKYIKLKENRGACYARNVGIKESHGKYIMFNDSDDTFDKKKIEEQYNNLIAEGSDMDYCKLKVYTGDIIIEVPTIGQIEDIKNNGLLNELTKGNFISTQSFLVKKSVIEKYLFDENLPRLQDYDLILRMIPHLKVSFTDLFLADLFRQKDSISISNVKLLKAITLILSKEYDLNKKQQEFLKQQLLNISNGIGGYIETLETKIDNLEKDKNNLTVELKKIDDSLVETQRCKQEIEVKYNKVVNSKGWQLLEKLRKIKKKILRK